MNGISASKIRLSYGFFVGVFTIIVGILFICLCADIYYTEGFSREAASERLGLLLVPMILWVVSIVLGALLSELIPTVKTKKVNNMPYKSRQLRKRLLENNFFECVEEKRNLKKIDVVRAVIWLVCAIFGLVTSIIFIVKLTDFGHSTTVDVNSNILTMLRVLLPWIILSVVLFIFAIIGECIVSAKENEILKKLCIYQNTYKQNEPTVIHNQKSVFEKYSSKQGVFVLRLTIIAVAVIFIVLGIINGGASDVLIKAVNICTECIGLG